MPARKSNLLIYLSAFILFAGAVGNLCVSAFSKNSVYFLNVAEAHAAGPEKLRQARLFGTVSEKDLAKTINSASFLLTDIDNQTLTIPVVYNGVIPDTFKSGAEVIVEGSLGSDGKFKASTLMTKCPSKYQKENRV